VRRRGSEHDNRWDEDQNKGRSTGEGQDISPLPGEALDQWSGHRPGEIYKTQEEAAAACRAVRKLFPAKRTTKPPLSEATRNSIRAKLADGLSHWKIAEEVKVSKGTVWRIAHERDDKAALGKDPREPVGDCW
jgi:hypothetical protein